MTAVSDQNDVPPSSSANSSKHQHDQNDLYENNQKSSSNNFNSNSRENGQDVFQIAAKAEKLLQEILTSNKSSRDAVPNIKQEPIVQQQQVQSQPSHSHHQEQQLQQNQYYQNPYLQQQPPHPQQPNFNYHLNQHVHPQTTIYYAPNQIPQYYQNSTHLAGYQVMPQAQYIFSPTGGPVGPGTSGLIRPNHPHSSTVAYADSMYFQKHPPPIASNNSISGSHHLTVNNSMVNTAPTTSQTYYYQHQQQQYRTAPSTYYQQSFNPYVQNVMVGVPYQPRFQANSYMPRYVNSNSYQNKRKFSEINNGPTNNFNSFNKKISYNNNNSSIHNPINSYNSTSSSSKNVNEANSNTNNNGTLSNIDLTTNEENSVNGENSQQEHNMISINIDGDEEEEEVDINIMRERELKELKCKSVVEKMGVFFKYYQQFKESYIQRVQTLECSDSLKIQFNSLIKYLNEYESLIAELDMMITEHERNQCKNNHRKTKKFFNKTKAFIRYECNKRLQSNIFEYRRLINSQDRYAGMYDLLDMNSYLISLLPDIGVSVRRYINRCEKAREEEQLEDEEYAGWQSENSNDSVGDNQNTANDVNNLTIPSFNEFVAQNGGEIDGTDENLNGEKENSLDPSNEGGSNVENGRSSSLSVKNYESFSMGIDHLNRYLLKRVEEEESLDELVKERILKWINKRQAKYILIFSEVDKLLNQHKAGECYSKFHSYLLFNLGKLVTVCDSYHQKLKELLYSTTIRRKKKRKKVKLLPEAMADVFNEIIELKRTLEHTKISIKRCNANK